MTSHEAAAGTTPSATDGVVVLDGVSRVGVKGAGSADALDALGVPRPAGPNGWVPLVSARSAVTGRVLRLGSTEYLVEQDTDDDVTAAIVASVAGAAQAWVVERADAAFLVQADVVARCLPQMTRFDVATLARDPGALAMTQLAGISVTLLHDPATAGLRLWCDAGYADYLLDCFRTLSAHSPP
jgi:sarcosine oxidase gamma subunit